ncbi:DUF6980 family protein [Alteromonas abrolhosensis]|uniref:DUF6980 family protein n=1 Tax=Alteromonas abrolhosensis TaxID=1892904 RepID=UPI0012FF9D38|nr:hypothetical protein [Alteromonas abrolhosensis]
MTIVMMLRNERQSLPKCCCTDMEDAIKDAEHPIYYSGVYQEYGLRLNSGYEYSIMKYCNWCGAELPSSRREQWFDSLEKQGIDPWENDIPIHYLSSSWWEHA